MSHIINSRSRWIYSGPFEVNFVEENIISVAVLYTYIFIYLFTAYTVLDDVYNEHNTRQKRNILRWFAGRIVKGRGLFGAVTAGACVLW